ncbi:MAG: TetR/AcrR family transcriptional regulator [Chloroflexi bacterium]|nr:TetR/AcrR family transcriptional regulator [Chloroflexota bacterium]
MTTSLKRKSTIRRKKKERITEQRKRQILDAALTVFSRKSFGAVTIPDISQEAGVAVGTIYNYFDNKHDLLLSLVRTYLITGPLVDLVARPPQWDDAEFMSSFLENRLTSGAENIGRFFFLFNEIQRNRELRDEYMADILTPLLKVLEKRVESGVASGAFHSSNPEVAARGLVGMILGFSLLRQIEGDRSPFQSTSNDEIVTEVTNLLLNGLLSRKDQSQ